MKTNQNKQSNTNLTMNSFPSILSNTSKLKIKEDYYGIMTTIALISFPIIFTFASLSLAGTFMFHILSNEKLAMTEGFSLTLLYFNCVVIGIFWGGTFGYQILGSHALGKGRNDKINIYHNQIFICSVVMGVIVALFSIFITPTLLELLSPDPEALDYSKELMFSFSVAIIIFALFQVYMRLANMIHNTFICLVGSLSGSFFQCLFAYILFNYFNLGITSIGIGYSLNFLFACTFLYVYFKKYDKHKLLRDGFSFSNLSLKRIFKQLKFSAFPMLNYILFLLSIESISFFGFMVDDLTFTVLTVLMNILSVVVVITEAISCSMSSLIAYSIGEKKYYMAFKIFRSGLVLSILIQIVLLGLLNIFPIEILSIFSNNPDFIRLAYEGIHLFTLAISLNSLHFLFCEFIIVYGNHTLPFYSLLFGKYFIQTVFAIILTPTMKLEGTILAMIIGQLSCLIIFIVYIYMYVNFENMKTDNDSVLTGSSLEEAEVRLLDKGDDVNDYIFNEKDGIQVK